MDFTRWSSWLCKTGSPCCNTGPKNTTGENVAGSIAAQKIEQTIRGADYVGMGPVFPTFTKKDAKPPCGLQELQRLKKDFPDTPLVAIGGIDFTNIKEVLQTGIDGAAIVSAILGNDNPRGAIRQFVRIFAEKKEERKEG